MQAFTRGPGPFVSVLYPTRKRVRLLCESVDSMYSLAHSKVDLEFVFKVDDDDHETIKFTQDLAKMLMPGQVKIIVSPRGRGYFEMHEWVNQMSRLAAGDWLILMNDDARMVNENWDMILASADRDGMWHKLDDICLLVARTLREFPLEEGGKALKMDVTANEFVILRRKTFELLGHFSCSPHNDNYIWSVMSIIGSAFQAGEMMIRHFSEAMDDEVRAASVEAYKTTAPELNMPKMIRAKMGDAAKLLGYIEKKIGERDKTMFVSGHLISCSR